MTTITIAVAGAGPVDKATINELLDDWLGIDANGRPTTEDDVTFVLPAAAGHVTPAVKAVYAWSGNTDPELPYTAVVAQTLDKTAKIIRDNAESAEPARDEEVYTVLGRVVAEASGDRFLLVAGDEGDDELSELVDYALDEGVTVLDLRDALKEIARIAPEPDAEEGQAESDEPEESPDEDPEIEEEPCEGGTQTLVPMPQSPAAQEDDTLEREIAAAHHKATAAQTVIERCRRPNEDVIEVLEAVATHLRLVDESNAAANLAPVRYRPITELAMKGLEKAKADAVMGAEPVNEVIEQAPEEPAEKPVKRAGGKVRKEWLNPDSGQWEPLRGRPRKDVQIREVAA